MKHVRASWDARHQGDPRTYRDQSRLGIHAVNVSKQTPAPLNFARTHGARQDMASRFARHPNSSYWASLRLIETSKSPLSEWTHSGLRSDTVEHPENPRPKMKHIRQISHDSSTTFVKGIIRRQPHGIPDNGKEERTWEPSLDITHKRNATATRCDFAERGWVGNPAWTKTRTAAQVNACWTFGDRNNTHPDAYLNVHKSST